MLAYRIAQFFCYVCGVAFLLLALQERSQLQLSEVEAFTTLLLTVCGTLLFICIGSVGGVAGAIEQRQSSSE
ncbi:MAG: hypothetical protein HQ518_07450 [Rhodopirellula sp.]|nr:hypothetical protein [Rhodopirellula sp.]